MVKEDTTNLLLAGLRPYVDEDAESVVRLMWVAGALPPPADPTVEEYFFRLRRRNIDPAKSISVLTGSDGQLIAVLLAAPYRDGSARLTFEAAVHPQHRGRGLGSALYQLAEEKALSIGATHVSTPLYVREGETSDDCRQFLKKRGYWVHHSFWQMRIDNLSQQTGPSWPSGYSPRRFGGKDDDAARWASLVNRAFNETATPEMVMMQIAEPGALPDGYFFAVDESSDREVGTSRSRIELLGGEQVGYIGTVGVLPEHRRKGLAEALVRETLHHLASKGLSSATLFAEEENKGARRLYERMGWRPVYRSDFYWKGPLR